MQIIFSNTAVSSPGVWLTSVAPHELGLFNGQSVSRGSTSVLLVNSPVFDEEKEQLTVVAEGVTLLNLGTTGRTVVIDAELQHLASALEAGGRAQGRGDREYRSLVDVHLKGEARDVAHELLTRVREARPGDLKRGERNNFSNTPDNFFYVIVQPRAQCLSITVRGEPDRFGTSALQLVADRPGYTRFQLRSSADLAEGLRIILSAKQSRFANIQRRT